ncbi:septum formation inhibitor Maf [Romeria aff. gracilis LEGE 07310]|uniref:Nucleoside triphosphate pyrophosphatase n=1 Tax=Vasconcelosia minhoensis LEGE 07310 TaxID=915328 RepID=A0A8J7AQJ2_9CYAN|nr:Maf family protein [Romeria gracilis]MBE9078601.1 septum formation inhibitor Maf [Romeria aff. gracilis LEGE 07310]
MLPQFVLASASPARRQLLIAAGIQPFVYASGFDEDLIQIRYPPELVKALARAKAELVAPQFSQSLVLGCDSVFAFNGEVYGKPESNEEAIRRWQKMRGHFGELYTGHALIAPGGITRIQYDVTRVHFAQVSDAEIEAYVATGEPICCAGAFTTDGRGSLFVEKLEGCHTNVIGLSLPLLRQMLADLGYQITDFWTRG